MKVPAAALAIVAASVLSFALESAAAPEEASRNLRATAIDRPPFVDEESSSCVRPYHRNCYYRGGNENAMQCCDGLRCVYTGEQSNPRARGGGENNPTNFVCVIPSDRERSADDNDGGDGAERDEDCLDPGWRGCYKQGANEDGTRCCQGSTCNYTGGVSDPRARQGGSHNPANFICEVDAIAASS